MTELRTIFWRRLDAPGHDVCRVEPWDEGWRLDGVAVFLHEGSPTRLMYGVGCDAAWRTVDGFVRGFIGNRTVDIAIERRPHGGWIVDGRSVHGFDHCEHLDFGFTPATNLPQVRSLALADGAAADVPVLWQDVPPAAVQLLPQRYERRGEAEAPTVGYRGLLELTSDSIVRVYPGLWELEATT